MTHDAHDLVCPRTDAVLAVHLDGALDDVRDLRSSDDDWGFAFVSGESLQQHLRDCPPCQVALARARRLDAALASASGREIADHAAARGATLHALGERLLERAAATACEPEPSTEVPRVASDGLATVLASALLLGAVGLGAWLLVSRGPAAPTDRSTPQPIVADAPRIDAGTTGSLSPGSMSPGTVSPDAVSRDAVSPGGTPNSAPTAHLPIAAAGRLRDGRDRTRLLQQRAPVEVLAARIGAASLATVDRLEASEQLLRAARTPSVRGSRAAALALGALVGATDRSDADAAVHAALLTGARRTPTLLTLLAQNLDAPTDAAHADAATGAVVVAARIGDARLDEALRRALRRDPRQCEVLAAALRSGARTQGAASLLLEVWQDQVELGRQEDSPAFARFWFGGQHEATFDELAGHLDRARAASDRIRCLLAMGWAADDRTVAPLVAHLDAPRHAEAGAAACALASLSHRALEPLIPAARRPEAWLLRAALARAGLPAADAWIDALGLSPRQSAALRGAPRDRFHELAGWFRDPAGLAD